MGYLCVSWRQPSRARGLVWNRVPNSTFLFSCASPLWCRWIGILVGILESDLSSTLTYWVRHSFFKLNLDTSLSNQGLNILWLRWCESRGSGGTNGACFFVPHCNHLEWEPGQQSSIELNYSYELFTSLMNLEILFLYPSDNCSLLSITGMITSKAAYSRVKAFWIFSLLVETPTSRHFCVSARASSH
jgi:hypothetical protein